MPDNGLLGWVSESWLRVMVTCAIWEAFALVATGGFLALVWTRKAPEWRTQVNKVTGERKAGMRNYLLGAGGFFSFGPVAAAFLYSLWTAGEFIRTHSWVLPVGLFAAGLIVAAVFAVKWRRARPPEPEPVTLPPVEQPQTYYYGQWSGDEQVIR